MEQEDIMKQIIIILFMFFLICVCGCSENKAKELFETAKFEELQNNPEHARQLYREILDKYPDSEVAAAAKEQIDKLERRE